MKLVVISNPKHVLDEHEIVHSLFKEGLQYFHLRKPAFSLTEMETYITNVDKEYRKNIIIHSHHELCDAYDLKGVHYTMRLPFDKEKLPSETRHISSSLHSLKEVEDCYWGFDYVFLSPVFNSISKEGYKSNFDYKELKNTLSALKLRDHPEVIALGGMDASNLEKAKELGFDGVAVLGALWNADLIEVISKFRNLREACNKIINV